MGKKGKSQEFLEYAAARALLSGLGALPRPAAVGVGRALGRAAYRVAGGLRRTGLRNLELAFPEMGAEERERILRGSFESLGRQLGEVSQFPRATPGEPARGRRVRRRGRETPRRRARARPRGHLPHLAPRRVGDALLRALRALRASELPRPPPGQPAHRRAGRIACARASATVPSTRAPPRAPRCASSSRAARSASWPTSTRRSARASSSPSSATSPARPPASRRWRCAPTPPSSPSARPGTSGAASSSSAAAPSSNSSARATTDAMSKSTRPTSRPPSNATCACSRTSGSGYTNAGRHAPKASPTSTHVRHKFPRGMSPKQKFLHRRQPKRFTRLSERVFTIYFNL